MMRWMGVAAAALHVAAVAGFGTVLGGYSMTLHPVALLGAGGVPHALPFNLLALVLPGVVSAGLALQVLRSLPGAASRRARVAAQMLLLAGLAFVAMGLLPLDAGDIDGPRSRLHAGAWMLWIVAFVPGAFLLGAACARLPGWKAPAWLCIGAALGVLLAAFALPGLLPAALAQRLAFLSWAAWLAALPWLLPATPRRTPETGG
ncbi:MAG: DUF998 domain-containing protein [Stenotrophomonas sp.]